MSLVRSTLPSGRLIILFSIVAVTIIAGATALFLFQLRVRELRHAEGESVSLSRIISEQTTRALQSVDLTMRVALDELEYAEDKGFARNSREVHGILLTRIAAMPHLRALFVVDADGTVSNSSRDLPATSVQVRDRDYFTQFRESPNGKLFVAHPLISRAEGSWTLHLSRAIAKRNGEFGGVIVAALELRYFESLYGSIKLDAISPISLLLNDGTLIVAYPHDESAIGKKTLLPDIPFQGTSAFSPFVTRTEGAEPGTVTFTRISEAPMILAMGNRDSDALKYWREVAGIVITGAAVSAVLMLLGTTVLWLELKREAAAARASKESGERLAALVNSARDAIVTSGEDQRISLFNPAAERIFGYRADQVIGQPLDILYSGYCPVTYRSNINPTRVNEINKRMQNVIAEAIGLRADGSTFPVEMTTAHVSESDQVLTTTIIRDISRRSRAEEEVRQSRAQLRELATDLQAVREEERTKIARELHDELGQRLMRLSMDLSWLAARLKGNSSLLEQRVTGMRQLVEDTVQTVRRVTTQLRPLILDDLGLADAVRWQLEDFSKNSGVAVDSNIAIDNLELDGHIATNVFRILQESLTNIARHAEAKQVRAALLRTDEGLCLEIRDDGIGKDLEARGGASGHGLVGIRERVLALGGRTEISSAPGQGFMVRVCIPLDVPVASGGPQ
jgi:PAS domain S-box-containing protein